MLLFLKYAIKATGDNDLLFFETAYYWRFQKRQEVFNDLVQYRLHAIVPKYVEEYVRHLQQTGGWDAPKEAQ